MENLDSHSTSEAFEDCLERFIIWGMIKKDVNGIATVARFFTLIGKETYSSLKCLAFPMKSTSLPNATLKEVLLNHVE
ncbi:unnamed protein product [Schistosoma mattheei]|uniref:Uncharacterized protein n=1 Tax=Schistosoma mattheei TaxID=31246 RepID=A0A183PC70_9TREM|nr:unnamed protein product [Schistosoma mattheei]